VVLGKDFYDLQIYSSEFLIDDNTLFFLVSDADKNICLFTYAPYSKFFFFSFPFLFYYIFIIFIYYNSLNFDFEMSTIRRV